ncbi:Zinc finger protein 737 [Nymphon striatum]|nr:Zinc finger protein 737 [Nymphon striatum]
MASSSNSDLHNNVSTSCSDIDDLEANCKGSSDKNAPILCWPGLTSMNDLNSSYLINDSGTNLSSSLVSSNTDDSRSYANLHRVSDAIAEEMINAPSTSMNLDSDIKMDQLNYMLSGNIDSIDVNGSVNSVMEFDQSTLTAMSFLSKSSNTNDSSSHLNLESFSSLAASQNLDSAIDEPIIDINSSHLNEHCSMTTNDDSLQQFSDGEVMFSAEQVQKLFTQASDSIKASSNHLTSTVMSTSVPKYLINIANSSKTNLSNQGSSSTIIVPSIKNTITCPAPAPVHLAHVPEVNNILTDHCLTSTNFLTPILANSNSNTNGALVEQVTCLKCRLCQFISLDKNEVDVHIKTVHSTQQSNQQSSVSSASRDLQAFTDSEKNYLKSAPCDSQLKYNSTHKNKSTPSNLDVTTTTHLIITNDGLNLETHNDDINFYVTSDQNSVSQLCSDSVNPSVELKGTANPVFKFSVSPCDPVLTSVSTNDFAVISPSTKVLTPLTEKAQNRVITEGTTKLIQKFRCCFCPELFNSTAECHNHIKKHDLYLEAKPKNCKVVSSRGENKVTSLLSNVPSKDIAINNKSLRTVPVLMPDNIISSMNQSNLVGEVQFTFQNNDVRLSSVNNVNNLNVCTNESILSNEAQSISLPKMFHNNVSESTISLKDRDVKKTDSAQCEKLFVSSDLYNHHVTSEHQSQVTNQADSLNRLTNTPISTLSQTLEAVESNCDTISNSENRTNEILKELPSEDVETPSELRKCCGKKKKTKADGTFICDFKRCNMSYRSERNLIYHKRCHVHDKTTGGFCCPECQVKTNLWRNMSTHLWKAHQLDMELYTCEFCDYKTWSFSRLHTTHKLIHGEARSFLCDVCGKGFKTYKQMKNHKVGYMIIHTNKKRVRLQVATQSCDICKKVFRHSRILQLHKETVHDKIRPFLCNFCGHCAANRSSLKMHLRVHTGEKPYNCDICNYKTSDHNSLRRHKMRHSGEKPYKCPNCHYACIQSSTFKAHLKKKHNGQNGGLLHSCKHCSFKTIKSEILESHMFERHGDALGSKPMTSQNTHSSFDNEQDNVPVHSCKFCNFTTIKSDVFESHMFKFHESISTAKMSFIENGSSFDNSVSINLLPANDGSITLTSKEKPMEVLGYVQVPDSGSIQTPGMDASLQNMVSTDMCTTLTLPGTTNMNTLNTVTLNSSQINSSFLKNNDQILIIN